MKKLFLIVAVAALTVTTSFAQGEVRFGAKGGLNLSSVGGDAYYSGFGGFDSRTSFHIGALVEIPVSEKISVQPEVLYSSQGSKFDFGFLYGGSNAVKLDYVNIPIMGKYHVIAGLSGELGPVIGFLVKAEQEVDDLDPIEFTRASTVDVKDSYKSIDIAIGIGATYRFPMGVFGSLRYNKGLQNINDDPNVTGKNQNNVFQISAGYSF